MNADSSANAKLLLVDDNPVNLRVLSDALEPAGHHVLVAPSGEVALKIAARAQPDLILLDFVMPEMDGLETCRALKADAATRDIPVLFISARGEMETVVSGLRSGGVDFISKPFRAEEVLARVETHLRLRRLTRELQEKNAQLTAANAQLEQEIHRREHAEDALQTADARLHIIADREAEHWNVTGLIGQSATLAKILANIRRLHQFGATSVLITGESGTGKELIARAVHFGSARAKAPFIPVNCVAVPEDLAESMFFGHVRGAFTGATADRKGYFELAHGGTLFLDEIGDMPLFLQAKLLRVLEDGLVTPVGATRERRVDVRIVAATNVDLAAKITLGLFRQDLYFRLARFIVSAPPLRERREDIAPLANHFAKRFAQEMGMKTPRLNATVLATLEAYNFPGNVRELKNIIERSLIESSGLEIHTRHLYLLSADSPPASLSTQTPTPPNQMGTLPATVAPNDSAAALPLNFEAAENVLIQRALEQTGGNIAEAARMLGIHRTRIYRNLAKIQVS
ncbi:MAG: sigma-54-dependent Fis family transcriptional regulator [Verrucomicrobia bacterium]|nr:sigma-54-dependent Fis family transcriptional regulator [Verrucomicrobiota bacterium]